MTGIFYKKRKILDQNNVSYEINLNKYNNNQIKKELI